jgi:hypothetical protein
MQPIAGRMLAPSGIAGLGRRGPAAVMFAISNPFAAAEVVWYSPHEAMTMMSELDRRCSRYW